MDLDWNPDIAVGNWIAPRLLPWLGGGDGVPVCSQVPLGHEAYLRLLHPIGSGSWRDACAHFGKAYHPLVQWTHVAVGRSGRSCPASHVAPDYDEHDPADGSLDPAKLQLLVEALSAAAPESSHAVNYGLWHGFGAFRGGGASVTFGVDSDGVAFSRETSGADASILDGPTLELPGRSYFLFTGPLTAVGTWGIDGFAQSPNLMWPDDRSWFVATEIDWDSTLIGGSEHLVATIEAVPGLETFRVQPEDDLSWAGDTLNPQTDLSVPSRRWRLPGRRAPRR